MSNSCHLVRRLKTRSEKKRHLRKLVVECFGMSYGEYRKYIVGTKRTPKLDEATAFTYVDHIKSIQREALKESLVRYTINTCN